MVEQLTVALQALNRYNKAALLLFYYNLKRKLNGFIVEVIRSQAIELLPVYDRIRTKLSLVEVITRYRERDGILSEPKHDKKDCSITLIIYFY